MLDARHVADHLDEVKKSLMRRSAALADKLTPLSELSEQRLAAIGRTEALQAERNRANQAMAELAKGPDQEAFAARRAELKALSEQLKKEQEELTRVTDRMQEVLVGIPNLPDPGIPDGASEADNEVLRVWGEKPEFDFEPKSHIELGEKLGILDFERGAKLSGARFTVLYGLGARLSRSLIQFMLNLHTQEHGYTEVLPPFLVKGEALFGTGQLPKFEEELFKTARTGSDDPSPLYLIPTAEVPVTNLHQDEILEKAQLPLAYTAYTPCFRSEAGSYGKDVRGLIRQHQFEKVELVRFVEPEDSMAELERLTGHAEAVLQKLGLHYRVVDLCAGDISASAARTIDLEVWLPSQQRYREISSCSTFTDYQARRAKIRYRPAPKQKPRLVHTLNGSGLAVGRTLVAILEQMQRADGSVAVPEALREYLGANEIR